jgi:hypothetical protein
MRHQIYASIVIVYIDFYCLRIQGSNDGVQRQETRIILGSSPASSTDT